MELKSNIKQSSKSMENNNEVSKKVCYEIIDEQLYKEVLDTVNKQRIKENKEKLDSLIPIKAHDDDAAYDLFAMSVSWDDGNDCWVYHSNLRLEPPKRHKLHFAPRSSNRKTECYLANSPATGDYGYRGEYIFCFKPRTSYIVRRAINTIVNMMDAVLSVTGLTRYKEQLRNMRIENRPPYIVGERFVQMECVPIYDIKFSAAYLDPNKTERGEGGHGASGKF